MSEWFRVVTVHVPRGKEALFLEVYRHHGWSVESTRTEHQFRIWIPEGRVMEVRRVSDGASFLKPGVVE